MWAAIRIAVGAVLGVIGAPVVAVMVVVAAFVYLPLPAALPPPNLTPASQVSTVYDAAGNQIGEFRQVGQNIPVRISDIPTVLKQAVVSSEDRNFYHEGGVSFGGTLRAAWADVTNGKTVQGGSTITQQYVKNAYTNGRRTLARKLREAVLATQLSRSASKDQVMYDYLSTIYFGEGAYGVGAAAEEYFRIPVSQLDASQAALLVGLIPAPSDYDPLVSLALGEQRRQLVLGEMAAQHYLDPGQYQEAMAEALTLPDGVKKGLPQTVVYPPPPQAAPKYPYFSDYVRRYLLTKLGPDQLYKGGLRIQTTLDPAVQANAQQRISSELAGTSPPLEMSLVSVEPATGYVKSLIGGRDFAASQVNIALGGCPQDLSSDPAAQVEVKATCWNGQTVTGGGGGLQAGSAFKPFTLAAALSEGVLPSRVYPAPGVFQVPGCTGSQCAIHNAEGGGQGPVSVATATWLSINTVYAQIIRDAGVAKVAEMAKKLGITSAWYSPKYQGLTYTLGVVGVSPLDMASAYSTFANHGLRIEPSPVVRVVGPSGKAIIDNTHPHGAQVISKAIADNVTDILTGVIQHGTGYPNAVLKGRPAAGKTGTTEGFHDAWFVGYTPSLSTAVQMGFSDFEFKHTLTGIKGVGQVFGGTIPAQVWHDFMSQALQGVPVTAFDQPPPLSVPPDVLALQERHGINPGDQLLPAPTGSGGPYIYGPSAPSAPTPPANAAPAPAPAPGPAPVPVPVNPVPPSSTTTTTPGTPGPPGATTTTNRSPLFGH